MGWAMTVNHPPHPLSPELLRWMQTSRFTSRISSYPGLVSMHHAGGPRRRRATCGPSEDTLRQLEMVCTVAMAVRHRVRRRCRNAFQLRCVEDRLDGAVSV